MPLLERLSIRTRVAMAVVCLGGLLAFVWRHAFAQTTAQTMGLILGGAVLLLTVAILVGIAYAAIGQAILRAGGTDPDWLIFPSEPPGLVRLRARLKDSSTHRPAGQR